MADKEKYGVSTRFRGLKFLMRDIKRAEDIGKKFCFILGAGASIESGIPSGQRLVKQWDEDIRARFEDDPEKYEEWLRRLGIKDEMEDKYSHYSDFYHMEYEEEPEYGPVFIRNMTAKAEPSVGYLALATVMTETRNDIVITTNFDKLVETSIFRDTEEVPWVIGTAEEIPYLEMNSSYPKILKIHGDMFLDMKNDTKDIAKLDERWKTPLMKVLSEYHPIFLGYAGNDPSLMGYLEELNGRMKRPYWVYYREEELSERIWNFVAANDGWFIDGRLGFDAVLLLIFNMLGFDKDYRELGVRREEEFREKKEDANRKLELLLKEKVDRESTSDADSEIAEMAEQITGKTPASMLYNWWNLPDKEQEGLFKRALKVFPEDGYVLGEYALYLTNHGLIEEAGDYYNKALAAAPEDSSILQSYAGFLSEKKEDIHKAEIYYKKAIKNAPKNGYILDHYAGFLYEKKEDVNGAEEYYKRAMAAAPENGFILLDYARLLWKGKGNLPEAGKYYEKAIEAAPEEGSILWNYAIFLWLAKKDIAAAETNYRRAIDKLPNNKNILEGFANFLAWEKKDVKEADKCFQKALKIFPEDPEIKKSYEEFLRNKKR